MAKKTAAKPAQEPAQHVQNGTFPVAEYDGTFAARLISVRLTPEEAIMFRTLKDGLDAVGARLPDGKHVENNNQVVRYLLHYAIKHSVKHREPM